MPYLLIGALLAPLLYWLFKKFKRWLEKLLRNLQGLQQQTLEQVRAAANAKQQQQQERIRQVLETDRTVAEALLKRAKIRQSPEEASRNTTTLNRILSALSSDEVEVYRVAACQTDLAFDLRKNAVRSETPYPTSDIEFQQITDFSQLPEVCLEQLAMGPVEFFRQAAVGELVRPVYHEERVETQLLYVLLDVSTSMRYNMSNGFPRHVWSRGVVVSLLLKAVRGEAKYFMRFFAGEPHKLMQIATPEQAETLAEQLLTQAYTESTGTRIPTALRKAVEDIRTKGGDISRSELLLITDGISASESISESELRGLLGDDIRLHVVSVGCYDPRDGARDESPVLQAVAASYRKIQ